MLDVTDYKKSESDTYQIRLKKHQQSLSGLESI